jgi:hypothetical protein
MITSFEVGSIFKIVNQATPQLRAILKAVTELDTAVENTRKNLTGLARTKLVGVGSQFKAITAEVATLDRALTGTAAAIGRFAKAPAALTGITSAVAGQSAAVQVLADEWAKVAASATTAATAIRSASRLRLPPPGGIGGGGAGGGGAGGGGRGGRHGPRQGWHLGRFGVGVPVLGGHVHASTPSSTTGVAVGAGLFGVYELMKQAEEPLHERAGLQMLGIDDKQPGTIARMEQKAREIATSVPGSGYSHNLKTMGELYSIVGSDEAMAIAPKLAEIDRVQSLVGGKGKDQGSAYTLTRATELMGALTDPVTHKVNMEQFGKVLDNMSRISIATHGKVTPEEWFNYAKQAGPAAANLDENGLYTTGTIIQSMGGYRAGTAANSIQRQFAGGVMTESKAKELEQLGIFKPGDYEVAKGGHVLVKNDAAKSFVDKLQKDPLNAVVQDLIPALKSHGYGALPDMTKELYRFLSTAPAQREMYELIRGSEQAAQERERGKGAWGPQAAVPFLNQNDPIASGSAFGTAFHDMLGAIGSPLMTAAIPAMTGLTRVFNELSAAAGTHPKETTLIASALTGTVAGATAGFLTGMAGGPVGAIGGALAGGVLGTASGFMATQEGGHHETAYDRRQERLKRQGLPTDDASPGMSGWNVVPLPQKIDITPSKTVVQLDGRVIGEAVTNWLVAQGNGPAQGSPYPDTTRGGSTFDHALLGN